MEHPHARDDCAVPPRPVLHILQSQYPGMRGPRFRLRHIFVRQSVSVARVDARLDHGLECMRVPLPIHYRQGPTPPTVGGANNAVRGRSSLIRPQISASRLPNLSHFQLQPACARI